MSNFNTIQAEVEALYVGYFMRAGDPGGTQYWISKVGSGALNSRTGSGIVLGSARNVSGLSLSRNRHPRRSGDRTGCTYLHQRL